MVAAGKMLTAILSHAPDNNGLTRFINELRTAQKTLVETYNDRWAGSPKIKGVGKRSPIFSQFFWTFHLHRHSLSKGIYAEHLGCRIRILQVVSDVTAGLLRFAICPVVARAHPVNGHLSAQSPGAGVAAQPV